MEKLNVNGTQTKSGSSAEAMAVIGTWLGDWDLWHPFIRRKGGKLIANLEFRGKYMSLCERNVDIIYLHLQDLERTLTCFESDST